MIDIIPDDLERVIITPHFHEGVNNRPVWLIWTVETSRIGMKHFPVLACVCSDERSTRYHILMALEKRLDVTVERVPMDHAFGSSLEQLQMNTHMALWKKRHEFEDLYPPTWKSK